MNPSRGRSFKRRCEDAAEANYNAEIQKPEEWSLIDELGELVQIGGRDVRDGAEFHPLMTPVNPLITLAGTRRMNGRVRFLGGQNKNVDEVLAARIDQSGDMLAPENIETPADERKSFTGGTKASLPLNQGLTVCWSVEATSVRWPGCRERT